jgi:hypothetical protein
MTTDRRYPAAFREAHNLIYAYSQGVPGIFPEIETRRLSTCLGPRAGCESPYCPSCAKRYFYKLEKRLWKVARHIERSELSYLTFILADCNYYELRSTARGIKAVATSMLKADPTLQGWFMRLEVTPSDPRRRTPGMCHPHVHVLAHYKPQAVLGRKRTSLRQWQTAWKAGLPEDVLARKKPVVIKPVHDVEGIVGYICKSPLFRAGQQKPKDIHLYAMQMLDIIAALAHIPSFDDRGTLKLDIS